MNTHASMSSVPMSHTSSTPLTQANIAAMSQPLQSPQPSEVSPYESASQVGVYPGAAAASVLSHGSPPTYHTTAGGASNAGASSTSQQDQHSGIGPLPGPHYATGAAAFPHANTASVLSPGSVFGSLPPGHAPSVTSHRPEGQ